FDQIHEAGDHYIAIGRVRAMDVQNPTLPLVFFQGGYGSFAVSSLVMASRDGLSKQVQLGNSARDVMEDLTAETGIESRAMVAADEPLVIVAAAGSHEGAAPVGALVPFSPPFGNTLVAWEGQEAFDQWVGRY